MRAGIVKVKTARFPGDNRPRICGAIAGGIRFFATGSTGL